VVGIITSLQNPTIRNVVKLRDNRTRQRERKIVVDGAAEIHRALDAGLDLEMIFVPDDANDESEKLCQRGGDRVIRVNDMVLRKISFGQHHRGCVATFRQPDAALANLTLSATPLVMVLDEIEKPGNVGAVFRSADAVGADAVVICEGVCDSYNPSVIRSSLGTVFTMPTAQANRRETMAWLRANDLVVITARVDAAERFWDVDYRRGIAVVIGSESSGLGDDWRSTAVPSIDVNIPMRGSADSLNASVSAALIMFEAARQRSGDG